MSAKTLLGAYIGTPGDSGSPWQSDLSTFDSAMGQAPAMVDVYVAQDAWTSMAGSAQWGAGLLAGQSSLAGMIPDIGIPMATAADSSADQAFKDIANGVHDADFEAIFQAYAAVSRHSISVRAGKCTAVGIRGPSPRQTRQTSSLHFSTSRRSRIRSQAQP